MKPIPIDIDTLVEQVIFSPWAKPELVIGIERGCRQMGFAFPISQSTLLRIHKVY